MLLRCGENTKTSLQQGHFEHGKNEFTCDKLLIYGASTSGKSADFGFGSKP